MSFFRVVYYAVVSVSFVVIGFLLVTKATGYRYNTHTESWQKTGMVILSTTPHDTVVRIDGQTYAISHSLRVPNLLPGVYNISVSKTGYQKWTDSITISPGYVVSLNTINLFLAPPRILPTGTKEDQVLATATADPNISLSDGELWYGSTLVSRFVTTPTNAILLPSRQQILYTLNNQIRIIEIDGHNDQLLYERKSPEITPLKLENDSTVLFKDGDQTVALRFQ